MNDKVAILLDSMRRSADSARRTAVAAGDVAADAAYGAGKKASAMLSVAKLNIRLMERQGAIEDALMEAGRILYATYTGAPADSDELTAKMQELDALHEEVAQLQAQLGKETPVRPVCSACGTALNQGDVFCGECGKRVSQQEPEQKTQEEPQQAPEQAPQEEPQQAPQEASVPQEASEQAPQEAPDQAPQEVPQEAPEKASSKSSEA